MTKRYLITGAALYRPSTGHGGRQSRDRHRHFAARRCLGLSPSGTGCADLGLARVLEEEASPIVVPWFDSPGSKDRARGFRHRRQRSAQWWGIAVSAAGAT